MEDIIEKLRSGKCRLIEINQSEKDNFEYIRQCIDDISKIKQFHYRDKYSPDLDHHYFGCIIKKAPIYIFDDNARNRLVIHDAKRNITSIINAGDINYLKIKESLSNSKSVEMYIKRNKNITSIHKVSWVLLIILCLMTGSLYLFKIINDASFLTISFYILLVIALQDCINVYILRFERKKYDKYLIFIGILEVLVFSMAVGELLKPEFNDPADIVNNILSLVVTIGTLLIKFDRPRN